MADCSLDHMSGDFARSDTIERLLVQTRIIPGGQCKTTALGGFSQ
jgi:hypothetical protein